MSKNIEILDFFVSELLSHDKNDLYGEYINVLSSKFNRIKKYKTASKKDVVDKEMLKIIESVFNSVQQADILYKQASFGKNSAFLTKVVLKTLQVAQKMLAGLLIKDPFKIGVAYNAMHNVIKYLEKELKKVK